MKAESAKPAVTCSQTRMDEGRERKAGYWMNEDRGSKLDGERYQERERLLGTSKAELNVNGTGWRNVEARAYFRFKTHALIELG